MTPSSRPLARLLPSLDALNPLNPGQRLDLPALAGMGLIVSGVLVINLFSKSAGL